MRLIDANKFIVYAEKNLDMQDLYLPTNIKDVVIDEMPTIEAIPIEWLLKWNKAQATRGLCNVKEMIKDWRKENAEAVS